MAQKRYWNWKDDDATMALSNWLKGFLAHGVYHGFKADLTVAGLNLNLVHTTDGAQYVDEALALKQNLGVMITKQGVLVQEDAAIVLPISAGDATNPRIDLIVAEHDYQQIVGGTQVIYVVIEGTPAATPVAPALTDANKQTIVGYLTVPATCVDLAVGTTWENEPISLFPADPYLVRTNKAQTITESKTINHQRGLLNEATISGTNLNLAIKSNFYWIEYSLDSRKTINAITGQLDSKCHFAYVFTKQKLRLTGTNNGGIFYGSVGTNPAIVTDGEDVLIDAGEGFIIMHDGQVLGTNTGNGIGWAVFKGGEAGKNNAPKFTSMVRTAKGADASINASNELDLTVFAGGGNFFEIISAAGDLDYMLSAAAYEAGGTVGEELTEGGTKIVLRNNSGGAIDVNNNSGSVPAKYKPILTPTGAAITFEVGAMMTLIEDEAGWRVTGYVSSTSNPFSRVLDDNTDVTLASVTFYDTLLYNGGAWVNVNMENLIAGVRHNFTKLQSWALETGAVIAIVGAGNRVDCVGDGNTFDLDLTAGDDIVDFKLGGGAADFPVGTLINIRISSITGIGGCTMSVGPSSEIKDYRSVEGNHSFDLMANDTMQLFRGASKWFIVSMNGEVMRRLEAAEADLLTVIADVLLLQSQNPDNVITKVVDIGVWDMDTTTQKAISHGIAGGLTKIRSVSAIIYNDSGIGLPINVAGSNPLTSTGGGNANGAVTITGTQVLLVRFDGGYFDDAFFNDGVMNRGHVVIQYVL